MNKRTVFSIALFLLAVWVKPVFAQEIPMSDPSAKQKTAAIPTDQRPVILKDYLKMRHSPFVEDAQFFVSEADRLNIDWRLVAAISGVESTFGHHIPTGSYNAWGWGVFTGASDGIHFANWKDGITKVSEGLRYNYMDKGAKTVDDIGHRYAASPAWSYKVKWFLSDMEAFQMTSSKALAVTI